MAESRLLQQLKDERTNSKIVFTLLANKTIRSYMHMSADDLKDSFKKLILESLKVMEANEDLEDAYIVACEEAGEPTLSEEQSIDIEEMAKECEQKLEEAQSVIQNALWERFGNPELSLALEEAEADCEGLLTHQPSLDLESYDLMLSHLEGLIKTIEEVNLQWYHWAPVVDQRSLQRRRKKLWLCFQELVWGKAVLIQENTQLEKMGNCITTGRCKDAQDGCLSTKPKDHLDQSGRRESEEELSIEFPMTALKDSLAKAQPMTQVTTAKEVEVQESVNQSGPDLATNTCRAALLEGLQEDSISQQPFNSEWLMDPRPHSLPVSTQVLGSSSLLVYADQSGRGVPKVLEKKVPAFVVPPNKGFEEDRELLSPGSAPNFKNKCLQEIHNADNPCRAGSQLAASNLRWKWYTAERNVTVGEVGCLCDHEGLSGHFVLGRVVAVAVSKGHERRIVTDLVLADCGGPVPGRGSLLKDQTSGDQKWSSAGSGLDKVIRLPPPGGGGWYERVDCRTSVCVSCATFLAETLKGRVGGVPSNQVVPRLWARE